MFGDVKRATEKSVMQPEWPKNIPIPTIEEFFLTPVRAVKPRPLPPDIETAFEQLFPTVPPLPVPRPKRRYRLSQSGRASLQASARRVQPWNHATGPRSRAGKNASKRNASRDGHTRTERRALRQCVASMRIMFEMWWGKPGSKRWRQAIEASART